MSSVPIQKVKRALVHRVCTSTVNGGEFGLIAAFGERMRWLREPFENRGLGNVSLLAIFLKSIECPPLLNEGDRFAYELFLEQNEENPQSVRALNLLEKMDGSGRGWGEASPEAGL